MDEYAAQLQEGVQRMLPIVLLGPGIALVMAGLFMWLGGLRFLKAVAAVTAGVAGLIITWLLSGGQVMILVLCPVIMAGLGMVMNRLVVVLLGAVIVAGIVLIGPSLVQMDMPQTEENRVQPAQQDPLGLLDSIARVQEYAREVKREIRNMIASIPPGRKTVALIVAMAFAALGLLNWRLSCAATCSTIGVVEIFAGMLILLLFKGTEGLRQAADQRLLLAVAAVGMIGLGTSLQMWLCPAKRKKTDLAKELLNEENKK
ncbi:MAG: hypothetical protein ACYSUT_10410 [Planctomycetota bacterium]|jgi:hypothetical protein